MARVQTGANVILDASSTLTLLANGTAPWTNANSCLYIDYISIVGSAVPANTGWEVLIDGNIIGCLNALTGIFTFQNGEQAKLIAGASLQIKNNNAVQAIISWAVAADML